MTVEHIAHLYLDYLERNEVQKIIDLFAPNGKVISPLYGTSAAKDFYRMLSDDTSESRLVFNGLFHEPDSLRVALLFDYQWTLKTKKSVTFQVVDIIEFNTDLKIEKLTIIYDTVKSRRLLEEIKKPGK